nr:MAG TPA: hypothetical protein [Caudoviricetes sp.]
MLVFLLNFKPTKNLKTIIFKIIKLYKKELVQYVMLFRNPLQLRKSKYSYFN